MSGPEFDNCNSADRPFSYGYETGSHKLSPPNEKRVGWGPPRLLAGYTPRWAATRATRLITSGAKANLDAVLDGVAEATPFRNRFNRFMR